MRAVLPMYDLPELREATDAWWRSVARALVAEGFGDDVPEALSRSAVTGGRRAANRSRGAVSDDAEMAPFREPDLLVGQTCGYPLTHELRDHVQVVATPRYAAPGCEGTAYRSAIVVPKDASVPRLDALRGATVAYSHESSHSGYHALRAAVAPLARAGRFFGAALRTGAHEASLDALREGYADVAAIDAVTYALLSDRRPAAVAHVRVLGWTPAAPGLPYVTRVETPPERLVRLRRALVAASRDPAAGVALGALRIDGMVPTETAMYARIVDLDEDARRLGYVSLG